MGRDENSWHGNDRTRRHRQWPAVLAALALLAAPAAASAWRRVPVTLTQVGLVTAVSRATVTVSALNNGALRIIQLQVMLDGEDSDGDGNPHEYRPPERPYREKTRKLELRPRLNLA